MEGRLPADSIPIFCEGIALTCPRGRDILAWFTQSTGPLDIYDLENMLDDGMLSLSVEVDDGSVEQVAETLMILHEECLEGNFRSIGILTEAGLERAARPHAIQSAAEAEDGWTVVTNRRNKDRN
ncbi:hypothetical protein K1719_013276 [Acacia pycnantha]|nr:hypothetical protein K1719_013276 [Acacia pycnantha]